MTDLCIITETREELASIGIDSRISPNLCYECRFRKANFDDGRPSMADDCIVFHSPAWRVNPKGECSTFERGSLTPAKKPFPLTDFILGTIAGVGLAGWLSLFP